MKFPYYCLCLLTVFGCQKSKKHDLVSLQENFIQTILTSEVEEGPFRLSYDLKTTFFSNQIVSLFGVFNEYTHLPHGHGYYEGKTYYKVQNNWKQLTMNDLFVKNQEREFLRVCCEAVLRHQVGTYFLESKKRLDFSDIQTFVISQKCLVVIFQPYVVGSYVDGPFFVKIPFEQLEGHWREDHPFCRILTDTIRSRKYVSSWDEEDDDKAS